MRRRIEDLSAAERERLTEALHAREFARCKASFAYWLFRYVKTTDPHTPLNPVKSFPKKDYTEFLANDLQHGEDIEFYAKSRQVMVSWIVCAFTVWKMLFYAHSHCYFQSKKKEDAAEMVFDTVPQKARMSFIMVNLPEWMQICLDKDENGEDKPVRFALDQRTFTYGSIILPNGSHCTALAQGAAQIEGKVPAFVAADECSLQEEWRAAYAATRPCISGGGRYRGIGTMRMPSDFGHEISTAADVNPDLDLRGIARFTSRSGIPSVRIHYSADPEKDPKTEKGAEWFAKETASQIGGFESVEWQQHYEINPQSISGQRCVPYWNEIKNRVVIDDLPFEQVAMWKIGGGADYGARNPSVLIYFAIDYHGNIYAVDEQASPGLSVHEKEGITKGGVAGLAQFFKQHPLFHKVNGQIQQDSTIWKQDQNTTKGLTSVAQLFTLEGVHFQPSVARGTDADDIALNRLHEWWAGYDQPDWSPAFFICRRCEGLIRILAKAEYQDWSPTAQKVNDLKAKMRGGTDMDYFDAMKHWIVSLPQGPARLKAPPPFGSFDYLRNLVRQESRRLSGVRG